jgi:Protein of unknown function (DUF4229)
MSPGLKYGLGRIGLFVVIAIPLVLLTPASMNFYVKLMIAFVVSAVLGYTVLRRWREELADHLQTTMSRRAAEKERLRAALAGEDELMGPQAPGADETGPAAGDRAEAADSDPTDPPGEPGGEGSSDGAWRRPQPQDQQSGAVESSERELDVASRPATGRD